MINKPLKSPKLRNSARGQLCTLRLYCCNGGGESTVLAHYPDGSGTGKMGGKTSDHCAGFACSPCHLLIDNLDKFLEKYERVDYWWFLHRSRLETMEYWINSGLIKVG